MEIINGQKIAADINDKLKRKLVGKKQPGLAVILIGYNPASTIYVKQKEKAAKELGVLFCQYLFAANCKEEEVFETIDWLNQDDQINGILIQLPLPKNWPVDKIIKSLDPNKDVDGLKNNKFTSPFIGAIIEAFKSLKKDLSNKKILAIVNSDLFGKKLMSALKKEGWIASYNVGKTKKTKEADILICACGKPKMIKGNDIKKDAILIDGGISQVKGKTIGDIDKKSVEDKAKYLCPVPGGIGPLTVALLYENLINSK